MDFILNDVFSKIDILILIFIRMSSFFIVAPIFGGRNIPSYTKIGLSFFISIIIISTMDIQSVAYQNSIMGYALVVIKEFVVGLLIGFIVYLVYSTLILAGQLIDFQIGFTMVNVFDPLSQIQVPITGNFYYFLLTMLLVVTRGYHTVLRALIYSFQVLPIGSMVIGQGLYNNYIDFVTDFFITAFKIASPIMGAIFILNVALGILARTAPQMNMFVVGLPLKIIVGMLTLIAIMPAFTSISDYIIQRLYEDIFIVIKGMIP